MDFQEYAAFAKPVVINHLKRQFSERKTMVAVCLAIGFLFNFLPKFAFYLDKQYDSLNYFAVILLLGALTAACFFLFALTWISGVMVLHAGFVFLKYGRSHKNDLLGLELILRHPSPLLNAGTFIISVLLSGWIYYACEPLVVDVFGNNKTAYILRQFKVNTYN